MKTRHVVIILVAVVLLGLIYLPILLGGKEEKSKSKPAAVKFLPVIQAKNKKRSQKMESYGQVTPNVQIDIMFEVQGRLKKGDLTLRPGTKFRKGQVLYEIDNKEAILSVQARKVAFKNLTNQILADIELDYSSELSKWSSFYSKISAGEFLPKLPSFNSSREERFINSRGLLSEYYSIRSTEERLMKYYYVAPFSGTVISTFTEPGALASPGMRIASVVKTGDYEVKIPVQTSGIDVINSNEKVNFLNDKGELIGSGKLLRVSDVINQRTQSVDAYFSISAEKGQSIYSGMFVSFQAETDVIQNSVALPRMASDENVVSVVKDSTVVKLPINIVGKTSDSIFVTGINDGDFVVLEPFVLKSDSIKIVGVERN